MFDRVKMSIADNQKVAFIIMIQCAVALDNYC